MARSLIQRALVVLLFAALLAPALEAFDRWDSSPGLASDTEFHVAALAMTVGLVAAVAFAAVRILSVQIPLRSERHQCAPRTTCRCAPPLAFFSGSSPPDLPLRI